ncbi:hypothetical protein MKX08_003641 [Trichoderma sp. CBMAI-0020]|nr:hypothetical protein MKX08_003641 [Trichoderma sp. CBMAI-0020]
MSTLTEFTYFPRLPVELRIEIWKLVPEPDRLIGWVPCSNCEDICKQRPNCREEEEAKPLARQQCMEENHPDWLVKYVAHPRKNAIFAPLHACRESREVWMTKYFQPPRNVTVNVSGTEIPVKFNVPFLNYEHDVFTMFGAWSSTSIFDVGGPMEAPVEPFIGLDRSRIQHGGYCEIMDQFFPASTLFEVNELPALKRLSLITMGPQPQADKQQESGVLMQMTPCTAERYDCQIVDLVSPEAGENSAFMNESRPRAHRHTKQKKFDLFYDEWKAWLWHVAEADAHFRIKSNAASWWKVVKFSVADNGAHHHPRTAEDCPLYPDRCTGPAGHGRCVIDNWESKYELSCKYLVEDKWANVLQHDLGVKLGGWQHPINREAKNQEAERIRDYIDENYQGIWQWIDDDEE